MRKTIAFFILSVLLFFLPSLSQADERFKKGTWELGIGAISPGLFFSPSISYFFKDNLQGILHFNLGYSKNFDKSGNFSANKSFFGRVSTGINYNFLFETPIVPVIGGAFFYTYSEFEVDGNLFGQDHIYGFEGLLGVRHLVGEKSSVNLNLHPTTLLSG